MKRIGIACRVLAHNQKDGIAVYSSELLNALQQLNLQVTTYRMTLLEMTSNFIGLPLGNHKINNSFDLLHVTDYLIPRNRSIPIIGTVHDAIFLQHPEWARGSYRTLKNFFLKSPAKYLSHVIAVSEAVIPDLVKYWNIERDKITPIYHGVSKNWFVTIEECQREIILKQYNIKKKYLLFVGTLQPRKNVLRILQAYHRLPKDIKQEYNLILIGKNGWQTEDVLKEIQQLTDNGHGKWLEYVPTSDLRALYQSADIFLFPSLYEGFGLPILEAFASNIPVITSTIPIMQEICKDAALLVDPYSLESIKQGILQLVENQGLKQNLAAKGNARAKQFTWEDCAKKTLKVYQQFIEL
jgi:glycosyltransferase involved in cell wall biosynthesis